MHIHEYQAKHLLLKYGIPTPPFAIASCREDVLRAIKELSLKRAVIKVQIQAGGRGKAGGVRFAENPDEIIHLAEQMLGMLIINNQTGSQGIAAEKILIMPPISIQSEFYLAATIDRSLAKPILIASRSGGMEIEQMARDCPESLLTIPIQLNGTIREYHLLEFAKFMKWEGMVKKEGVELVKNLAKCFLETDGALLEINPLVLQDDGHLTALDAKFTIDDNALYRQPEIARCYDPSQSTPNEVKAKEYNLAYIGLSGEIGCLVNGAGLAMATMDIIHHYGGLPANFLDVGGGATREEIEHGFNIILLDPKVKAIFVNIFGGIMDCGILAQAISDACKKNTPKVPLIVRIEGTNVEIGRKILTESGLDILIANNMSDGAIKAVNAAKGNK